MKIFQKRNKFQHLLNLFLVIAFLMGMITLAPVEANARTVVEQDSIEELIIDQAVLSRSAFDGSIPIAGHPTYREGMPSVPGHQTMIPPGVSGALLNDAPYQAWESEAPFAEWGVGYHCMQKPMGRVMEMRENQQAERSDPDPRIMAIPQYNEVWGSGWTPNTTITLMIGSNEWTEESSEWGWVLFWNLSIDIQPGIVVQMTDGINTRTHTVTQLTVTEMNQDLNTVSGTADRGSEIGVWACSLGDCDWVFTVADQAGNWQVDFSGIVDFVPGAYVWAVEYDEEGNSTEIYRSIPDPKIQVLVSFNQVDGSGWTPNTTITLTIGSNVWTEESRDDGWVNFWALPVEILPGQVVAMTDGTYTRSHTVINLTVTEVNQGANTVRGTALSGSEVYVEGWEQDGWGWDYVSTSADGLGNWTAVFSSLNITTGVVGYAKQFDEIGNSTNIYWYVPDPYFQVYPLGNYIYGYRWPSNKTITASVGGSVIGSDVSNATGRIYISSQTLDIQPGHVVTLTDGTYTRTHTVRNLSVTNIDQEENIVSGTADANTELLYVSARDQLGSWFYRYPSADSNGNWQANFSGLVDITVGTFGWAVQGDAAGNETCIRWNVPYPPNISVYPHSFYVYGNNWPPNVPITLKIGDKQWVELSMDWGGVDFNVFPFEILPGQLVQMTDGTNTSIHTVTNHTVSDVDPSTDKVCGTAEPGTEIEVGTWETYHYYVRFGTADASGNWCADFSGFFDITMNTTGNAAQFDQARNATIINWYVVDPAISVYSDWNVVFGSRWPAGTDITLTIDDTRESWTERSSHWGGVYFELEDFDLQPGQLVEMRDQSGTYIQSHVVKHIAVTDIDIGLNTISGTADINTEIHVYACSRYECFYVETNSDGAGNWLVDFTGIVNIGPGVLGWVDVYDSNNNRTSISWRIEGDHQIFLPLIIR